MSDMFQLKPETLPQQYLALTLSPVTLFLTFSDLFEKFISIDWCKDILRNCG